MFRKILITCCFTLYAVLAAASTAFAVPQTWWVDSNYNGKKEFGTEAKPFKTIYAATINTELQPGDTILCKAGEYSLSKNEESFPILVLPDTSLISQDGPEATVIDASGTGVDQLVQMLSGSRIEGFTIFHPDIRYDIGKGIRIYEATNVTIEGNIFDINVMQGRQAWMIYAQNSDASILNNLFYGHYYETAQPHYLKGISSTGQNTLRIVNNTLSNIDTAIEIRDVFGAPTEIQMVNNVITFSSEGVENPYACGSFSLLSESNLFFGNLTDWSINDCGPGPGDLHGVDPLYVNGPTGFFGGDLSAYDFHLQVGSPAVDSGVNTSGYGVMDDLLSVPRPQPQGGEYDRGAYEGAVAVGTIRVEDISFARLDALFTTERLKAYVFIADLDSIGIPGIAVEGTLTLPDTTSILLQAVTDDSGTAEFSTYFNAGSSLPTGTYSLTVESVDSPAYNPSHNLESSDSYFR